MWVFWRDAVMVEGGGVWVFWRDAVVVAGGGDFGRPGAAPGGAGGAWPGAENPTAFLKMLPALESRSVRRLERASFWKLCLGDFGFRAFPFFPTGL